MEIKRDLYLNKLIKRECNGLVKVITGIRRCGKSYLLFHHSVVKSSLEIFIYFSICLLLFIVIIFLYFSEILLFAGGFSL